MLPDNPSSEITRRRQEVAAEISAMSERVSVGIPEVGIGSEVVRATVVLNAHQLCDFTQDLSSSDHQAPYDHLEHLSRSYLGLPKERREVLLHGLLNQERFPSMNKAFARFDAGEDPIDLGLAWIQPHPNIDEHDFSLLEPGYGPAIDLLQQHGRDLVTLNQSIEDKVADHKLRWSETIAATTWLPEHVREHGPDIVQRVPYYVDDGFGTTAHGDSAYATIGTVEPYIVARPEWASREDKIVDRITSGHEFVHVVTDQTWLRQGGDPRAIERQEDTYFASPRSRRFHEALTEQFTLAMLRGEYPQMPGQVDLRAYATERVEVGRCLKDARTKHTMADYIKAYFDEHLAYQSLTTWQKGGPYQPVEFLEEQLGFVRGTGVQNKPARDHHIKAAATGA